jgi:hypothetical protein
MKSYVKLKSTIYFQISINLIDNDDKTCVSVAVGQRLGGFYFFFWMEAPGTFSFFLNEFLPPFPTNGKINSNLKN